MKHCQRVPSRKCVFAADHLGPCSWQDYEDIADPEQPDSVQESGQVIVLESVYARVVGLTPGWEPDDSGDPTRDYWLVECPECGEQFRVEAIEMRFETEHNCVVGTVILGAEQP